MGTYGECGWCPRRSHRTCYEYSISATLDCGKESEDTRNRRPRSDKDRSSVLHQLDRLRRILQVQQQVLGRIVVRELERLLHTSGLQDEALAQALPQDLGPRKRLRLLLDRCVDRLDVQVVAVDRDEDGLRVEAVLLLAEQVGSDENGVGSLVGNDLGGEADISRRTSYTRTDCRDSREPRKVLREHRSRTSRPSPSRPSACRKSTSCSALRKGIQTHHLRRCDELVSRSIQLIRLGHALRSVRHSRDSVRTAGLDDRFRADKLGDVDNFGGDGAVGSGRGGEGDVLAAGDLRGNAEHQRSAV